jgi:ADP-heptose:LPS heptosyltransferase
VNKYLIFRTDRIGDFLLSMILIKNIKRNDKKSYIVVVSSEKNYNYIKTFSIIDEVIKLNSNFFSRVSVINQLRRHKFKLTIIHDGKNRSKFINFFIKKDKSIYINNDDIKSSHFSKIKTIIHSLNFNFDNNDLNILQNSNISNKKKDFIILHYDEKWSTKTYISEYKNIEPSDEQFLDFINKIIFKTNYNLVITTGIVTPTKLKRMLLKINNNIELIEDLNFIELQEIVSQSKLLISCHGAISHVASAYNIKQIDIIDINLKNPYSNWTDHFRNDFPIYRKNFKNLSAEILSLLN